MKTFCKVFETPLTQVLIYKSTVTEEEYEENEYGLTKVCEDKDAVTVVGHFEQAKIEAAFQYDTEEERDSNFNDYFDEEFAKEWADSWAKELVEDWHLEKLSQLMVEDDES